MTVGVACAGATSGDTPVPIPARYTRNSYHGGGRQVANSSNETGGCLLVLIVAGVAIWGGQDYLRSSVWGEREGVIKTDDCRTRVIVKPDTSDTWFKKFTCATLKTNKGVLIRQICEAVETSGAACTVVYSYERKGPNLCNDPQYPYLHTDDLCYNYSQ